MTNAAEQRESAAPTRTFRALHGEPFKYWSKELENARLPGGAVMSFAQDMVDAANGLEVIAQVLHQDEYLASLEVKDPERGERVGAYDRLLSPCQRERLNRFTSAALRQLAQRGEEFMEWADEHHRPGRSPLRPID